MNVPQHVKICLFVHDEAFLLEFLFLDSLFPRLVRQHFYAKREKIFSVEIWYSTIASLIRQPPQVVRSYAMLLAYGSLNLFE